MGGSMAGQLGSSGVSAELEIGEGRMEREIVWIWWRESGKRAGVVVRGECAGSEGAGPG